MLLFYFLLFLLILSRIRYNKAAYNDDYLSLDTTRTIKGIFILLVFIKHISPYIFHAGFEYNGNWKLLFDTVDNNIGQWIVSMFLFYSGYGVMESIKRKGSLYIDQFPRKRLLQTLVNFDIAVICFIVLDLLLGTSITLKQCLLSLVGWESVGNSNWYIFVIILLYIITYLSFKFTINYKLSLFLALSLSTVSIFILSTCKEIWWYNTMLCYIAGLFFSVFRNKIEVLVKSNYWAVLILLIVLMFVFNKIPYSFNGLVYNGFSILFCFFVLLLTLKFKVNHKLLIWCGKNLFPLYIYQRIPMIALSYIKGGSFAANYSFLFIISCLLITILLTILYNFFAVKL